MTTHAALLEGFLPMGRGPKKSSGRANSPGGQRGQAPGSRGSKGQKTAESIATRVQKAQLAWQRRQYDDAIRHYEQALALAPTHAVLLVDLARAYALRYRFTDAEELIERACRLHPDDAQLQMMLGRSFYMLQQFDRAIDCFRRALEIEPESPHRAETLYELTRMYERLHRLDEARACALESLALQPHQPVLQYLLGLVDRRAGELDSAEQHFHKLTESTTATTETLADGWYQLASISTEQGQIAEGYEAACEAKRILEKIAGPHRYDAADVERTARRTFATTSTEHLQRWHDQGAPFKPLGRGLALLTSHPRSGTTLLEQVLDSHPDLVSGDELPVLADTAYLPLCMPWPGEMPVPEILDQTPAARILEVRQDYWRAMSGALRQEIGNRVLLDKNPALTGLLPVVARVFPEMKIIFALRDPRDVVVSCFMQQLPLNPVSVHFLMIEGVANYYAATMKGWLKFRGALRNPWIEVRYEQLVANLEGEARKVCEFLEIPWDDAVLNYRIRAQEKHVHSPTYEAVTKPLYTKAIGRWREYKDQLAPCLSTLQPYVEAFGYAK
jgi:tetratricopeptide (TPR) repeat protein